jgi:hypothetical protein
MLVGGEENLPQMSQMELAYWRELNRLRDVKVAEVATVMSEAAGQRVGMTVSDLRAKGFIDRAFAEITALEHRQAQGMAGSPETPLERKLSEACQIEDQLLNFWDNLWAED